MAWPCAASAYLPCGAGYSGDRRTARPGYSGDRGCPLICAPKPPRPERPHRASCALVRWPAARWLALWLTFGGAAVLCGPAGSAAAICISPEIRVQPGEAAPGAQTAVAGTGFFVGCDDTAGPGEPFPTTPGPPDTGIEITFVQGDDTIVLAVVDALPDFTIDVAVNLPTSAQAGPAAIRAVGANGSPEASITVTELQRPVRPVAGLPRTGAPVVAVTTLGILLVGAGTALRRAAARER